MSSIVIYLIKKQKTWAHHLCNDDDDDNDGFSVEATTKTSGDTFAWFLCSQIWLLYFVVFFFSFLQCSCQHIEVCHNFSIVILSALSKMNFLFDILLLLLFHRIVFYILRYVICCFIQFNAEAFSAKSNDVTHQKKNHCLRRILKSINTYSSYTTKLKLDNC